MKILITGGAGFVGSALCCYLKNKYPEYEIIAFDNLKRKGSEFNLLKLETSGVTFIRGDIRNPEDFEPIKYFDFLIDASAEPSVLAGLTTEPTSVITNNLYGTINCLQLCKKFGAKFIFLSTSRVYPISYLENAEFEEFPSRFDYKQSQSLSGLSINGVSENIPLGGARSFYGSSKLAAELFIQEYSSFYNVQSAITRFGVIAGPGQMGKTDQGVAALWLAKHYFKSKLQYIGYGGTGKQVRDILHVQDAIELIEYQIHNILQFDGHIFNAGGGRSNSISLMEMSGLCENICGHKIEIESVTEQRLADLRIYISDYSKLNQSINWAPKYSLDKVFTDIFDWINQNEKTLKPLFI